MWVGTTHGRAFLIDKSTMNQVPNYYSGTTTHCSGLPVTYTDQLPTSNQVQQSNIQTLHHNLVETTITTIPLFTDISDDFEKEIHANIPLFLKGANRIKIPKKTQRAIYRYVPKSLLREINPDTNVAIELCLMFLANLSDTYYRIQGIGFEPDSYEKQGWKNLSSTMLRGQFSDAPDTYRKIIKTLEHGTNKGAIIECDYWKVEGFKCYSYRLSEAYQCKGIESYELKTEYAKELNYHNYYKRVELAMNNPIGRNLMKLYKNVQLPTREEIDTEATRLITLKKRTKKGKLLTRMGKKTKSYWKHPEQRSFIEESIEIFEYLTVDGLMIPNETSDRSGGRIVDSFTLMPSWIRNLCRVNGESIKEVDYTALHPNIAMSLFEGSIEFLTHKQVADHMALDEKVVKIEHLSFFNKRWGDMKKSPLFDYYQGIESELLENIRIQKEMSIHGHKATSRAMFRKEVEIMTDVVLELNSKGIYVGYVYDALFCHPNDFEIVKDTMNRVILSHGVKTKAK